MISQAGFAQEVPKSPHKTGKPLTTEQKLAELNKMGLADNDAGLPNRVAEARDPNSTSAICTTFTGQINGSDPTTSLRAFRDGTPSTCAVPGPCAAGISGSLNYDQFTWTNPVNAVQCVTVTFANTATNFSFVTAHNGSVVLSNLCTNWLGDPGSSAGAGSSIVWSFNAPALATIVFHVTNIVAGQTADYSITIDAPLCTPPAPCAGTPSPGNTIASVTAACPTTPVNLSLQNATPGSGVTYAWERSTTSASGPWTAFGTNAPAQSVTQTQRTWYRCTVTCTTSGSSGTSTPVQVDQNPFSSCYCASVAGSNADEDIFNVTFGTLNNSSTCATTAPGPGSIRNRYSNYTTLPTTGTVVTGTMPISVEVGTCGGNFGSAVGVWIDFNQNGNFEHPAERVFLSNTQTGPHIASGNATIPTSALTGLTGMRVINVETTNPAGITPCGAYTWGETEDYLINIQPCVPITSVTGPTTLSAQCSLGATLTNSVGSASFPTWRWEYRQNASSPWQFLNAGDLGGVVVSANTASLQLTAVPNSLNGYQFRSVVTNPCTALDFGPIATLTVTKLVATVNPTAVTICNNPTVQPISLTNASSLTTSTFSSGPLNIQIPDVVGPPASSNAVVEAGINHTIPVSLPLGSAITRIDVRVNITHTYASDLKIVLKNSTTNQVLNLFYHKSGNQTAGANFVNTVISSAGTTRFSAVPPPFTGTFRADLEMNPGSYGDAGGAGPTAFQPTTTNWNTLWGGVNQGSGNWTLAICDAPEWAGDIGTLTSWDMTITYGVPAAGVWTSTPAAPNTMFTDPAGTIAYTGTPVNTIYVKPAVNTTYCVVYSTPSPACTSDPTCVNVTVLQPAGGSTTVADRSVCVGGTTSFNVPITGGPFAFQWQESRNNGLTWANVTNGGVYSGATTATLTLTGVTRSAPVDMNNFKYRCVVNTAPCAGSTTTNVANLTVFALPTVTIAATDLALLPNQTTTITASSTPAPGATPNWVWTRDGSPVVGSTSSIVADIDRLGVYQATVTDINGCRNSSNQLLIEAEAGDKLWLYPNPTTGQFQIRLYYPGVTSEKRRIQIFNSAGAEVMSRDIMLSNVTSPHYQRFDVDLSFQPAGVYLVKVIDMYTKKATSGFVIKQSK